MGEEVVLEFKTAPVDKRFPNTNQTRHCYARYIEFHRCARIKGEDHADCSKFKSWYRSMCPLMWVSNTDSNSGMWRKSLNSTQKISNNDGQLLLIL